MNNEKLIEHISPVDTRSRFNVYMSMRRRRHRLDVLQTLEGERSRRCCCLPVLSYCSQRRS